MTLVLLLSFWVRVRVIPQLINNVPTRVKSHESLKATFELFPTRTNSYASDGLPDSFITADKAVASFLTGLPIVSFF